MDQLDRQIAESRRRIAQHERDGHLAEAENEIAHLRGLLTGEQALDVYRGIPVRQTPTCGHVTHTPGPLGNDGRTIWLCAECGEPA